MTVRMLMVALLGCLGFWGATAAAVVVDPAVVAQADELEKRWADQYIKYNDEKEVDRLNKAVELANKTLQDDGRFSDLQYGPIITGRNGGQGWGDHLLRVVDLFTAWKTPGTSVYGNAQFARKSVEPFEAYLDAPWDRNDPWGYGHPYADLLENNRIGRICLFAHSDLKTFTQAEVDRWAGAIPNRSLHPIFVRSADPDAQFTRASFRWEGGANVMWAVRGELVPYLVSVDQETRIRAIDGYMKHVWSSQTVRWPKGPMGQIERLTVDGMLGEHNAPCMGSYGEWYINAVVEYRDLIQGIPRWQMPAELNNHWIDVILDGVVYCYQGAIDPHLGNPLIWLGARPNGNEVMDRWLKAFSSSTTHRADEVKAVLAWQPGVTEWPIERQSARYFYTTDYLSKHFPHYMASVRAVSNRTVGMETFAQHESEKRWAVESVMLPLGTIFLRRDTREFQDKATQGIFTAMDFARLPGQTTRHVTPEMLAAAWNRDASGYAVRGVFGNTPFSGAVANAHTAVMGWWQSRYVNVDPDRPGENKQSDLSVNGRRAVFFLEDAIVNLGVAFDIRHDSQPTYTNLEQRASGAQSTTYCLNGQIKTLSREEIIRDAAITWAWHDGVLYLPPTDGVKVIQDLKQPGQPEKQVFSFWSDHGRDQRDLKFDWAVIPDVKLEEAADRADHRSWNIACNSPLVQAIEAPAKNWAGAVFHDAGDVTLLGYSVATSRACVLTVQKSPGKVVVTLADPLQTDDEITLSIGTTRRVFRFPGYPNRGSQTVLEIESRLLSN